MTSHAGEPVEVFVQRLSAIADLPDELTAALKGVAANVRVFDANQDIVRQGDRPSQCFVILQGWVSRNKIVGSGKRQITVLHFAGIAPDLQSLFVPALDHNITALTNMRAGFIAHKDLRELMDRFPALCQVFWQETLVEAAIAREWEVNLGARPAAERIAHLFCEMGTRLEWFGRASRTGNALSFAWPLSQSQLAEVTGLSSVHVNRSLQALRGSGLIEDTRQWMTIRDMPKLAAFAGFNADYLLAERPRSQNRQH